MIVLLFAHALSGQAASQIELGTAEDQRWGWSRQKTPEDIAISLQIPVPLTVLALGEPAILIMMISRSPLTGIVVVRP